MGTQIAPTCRILDSCEAVLHEADEESMDDREIQMDSVRTILKSRLEEVKAAGASKSSVDRLELVLAKYENVFRVEFATDPPVKVPALKLRLKEGVEPIMARSRRYPPMHRDYLENHLENLEKLDLIYRNLDSRWVVPHALCRRRKLAITG